MDHLPAAPGDPIGPPGPTPGTVGSGTVPAEREAEVIEPEIVGLEPPRPAMWRRILVRTAMSLILGVLGIGLCLMGAVLTLTVIGAGVGAPLIFLGFCLIASALFLFVGGGKVTRADIR